MQHFAEEVAPALREAVAARAAAADAATVAEATWVGRSTAVRAKRRAGIDYDALPASLAAHAVEPGDAGLRAGEVHLHARRVAGPRAPARRRGGGRRGASPSPARNPAVPLGVRSGGHGISGRSTNDGGIVIDLGRLDAMEVLDESARLVRIGAGARWKDVAAFLAPHGWALTSGDYGGVGVGGLATAGGIGWLVREHGLTIDHVRAVELVLADGSDRASGCHAASGALLGRSRRRRERRHRHRLRVRGRRGRRRRLRAARVRRERHRRVPAGVGRLGRRRAARPHELPHPGRRAARGSRASRRSWRWSTPTTPTPCSPGCSRSPRPPRSSAQDVRITSYRAVISNASDDDATRAEGEPTARSGLIGRITPEFARDAARFLDSGATYFFQLRAVGGAVHDVPADATAFAHRSAEFSRGRVRVEPAAARPTQWNELIAPHLDGAYLSFETEQGDEQVAGGVPARDARAAARDQGAGRPRQRVPRQRERHARVAGAHAASVRHCQSASSVQRPPGMP